MQEAREACIEASHDYSFNSETYVYLLMGLNHVLKNHVIHEKSEEEKAQVLSLVMTLLHKSRKVFHITNK